MWYNMYMGSSHFPEGTYITDEIITNELKKKEDYWKVHFTGKEKIQLMIDKIWEKYSELIDEDEFELCSAELHLAFTPEDQEKVLKVLQDKRKSIKFEVEDKPVTVDTLDSLDSVGECLTFYLEELHLEEFHPYWNVTSRSVDYASRCKFFKIKVVSGDSFREKSAEQKKVLYSINYNEMSGELSVNDIIIKKFQIGRQIESNVEYIFNRSDGSIIKFNELPYQGKNVHDMINQFGFNNTTELKKAFFEINGDDITFHKTITTNDITKRGLNEEKLEQGLRILKSK